jgi:hypothetical protein
VALRPPPHVHVTAIDRNKRIRGINPNQEDIKARGHRVRYRRVFVGS